MSETSLWVPADAVERAIDLVEQCRTAKWTQVHLMDRDDPTRAALVAFWDELGELAEAQRQTIAEALKPQSEPAPQRRIGETTREGLKRLDGNHGSHWGGR